MIRRAIRRAFDPIDARTLLHALPFLAIVVLAAFVSYRYHELLRAQRDRVDHTYQVLTTLDTTFLSIVDAETGQRGYLITGDDAYLGPYRDALAGMPDAVGRLKALVADSPAETQRAIALEDRLRRKLGELDGSIEARRDHGFDAARVLVVQDHGKRVMDDIRSTMRSIRETETTLLADRSAEAQRTEGRLLAVTAFCAVLSLAARIGLALQRRTRRER